MREERISYDMTLETIEGQSVSFSEYKDCVLLIANTASHCGMTPQYSELQKLHERYHEQGLRVMAFPCNQFGFQESGSNAQISEFCSDRYGVTFDVFAKTFVNGSRTHPLFRQVKRAAPGWLSSQAIKWNFTKFLVARDGRVCGRWAPSERPEVLEDQIQSLLEERHTQTA